jgi:hypothetical protein
MSIITASAIGDLRFVYSKWGTADSGATRFFFQCGVQTDGRRETRRAIDLEQAPAKSGGLNENSPGTQKLADSRA